MILQTEPVLLSFIDYEDTFKKLFTAAYIIDFTNHP